MDLFHQEVRYTVSKATGQQYMLQIIGDIAVNIRHDKSACDVHFVPQLMLKSTKYIARRHI